MKTIFVLFFFLFPPLCLKAQDATLGKTKEQIRGMIQPTNGIKLSKGETCDTLSMDGGLQTLMFYKNNICYISKSVMPLKYIGLITQKMNAEPYKKLHENLWLNKSTFVRVAVTIDKAKDLFYVETSQGNSSTKD